MLEHNKTQLLNNAGKERSTASAVGLARLVVTALFGLLVFLFSGCEVLQMEQQPSTGSAANYDKPPAQTAAMPAPAQPKKSAEFDAMMERLENRAPAPTITPRSEPIAVAVASPKATASNPAPTPGPARVAPGEPLIIRSAPPTPARAGASQLVATNPPPKSVETPAVAVTPAPARPQSLVVVGTHKPPPKSHAVIWKNLLLAALVLLIAASFLVSLAPVRERLLSLKVAATVWWSTRKGVGAGKERPKSKGTHHQSGPAWVDTVKAFVQQLVIWAKSLLLLFKRGETTPEARPIEEPHRPTPAEMLLKKIGAPPSNDISTSSRGVKVEHKQAETSTNIGQKPQETSNVLATGGASSEPAPTVPASAGPTNQPAPASAASESAAKSEPPAAPDEKAAARNRVLHAPFTPAIITLMSPAPEHPGASNGEKTPEPGRSAPVAAVPVTSADKGKVEAKSKPEPAGDPQKSQEARKVEEPASV